MSLKSRLILRCVVSFAVAAAMIFVPAGTVHFWEASVFLGLVFLPMFIFSAYFYKQDPAMVERRLRTQEKEKEQKVVVKLANLVFFAAFLIPGFDHRFGWTREWTGGVPLVVIIVAQAFVFGGYLFTFWVLILNRFAGRTVQVEAGQKVVSTGPYRLVRHPMYLASLVMWLCVPPALGSYVALPFFALLVPVIVVRLLNEEKVLWRDLPGYGAYCEQTRFRLIPYVW